MSPAPLYEMSTGHTNCYDEIGFVVNGPQHLGYQVEYTDQPAVTVRPSGEVYLQLSVGAGAADSFSPGQAIPLDGGQDGYKAVRDVVYAQKGESRSVFLLGLDEELPFTVTSSSSDSTAVVVVRIAHPEG